MEDPAVSSSTVHSMVCAAITSSLHRAGVLPIQAVIEELQEISVTNFFHPTHSEQTIELLAVVTKAMTQFAAALPPFVRRPP